MKKGQAVVTSVGARPRHPPPPPPPPPATGRPPPPGSPGPRGGSGARTPRQGGLQAGGGPPSWGPERLHLGSQAMTRRALSSQAPGKARRGSGVSLGTPTRGRGPAASGLSSALTAGSAGLGASVSPCGLGPPETKAHPAQALGSCSADAQAARASLELEWVPPPPRSGPAGLGGTHQAFPSVRASGGDTSWGDRRRVVTEVPGGSSELRWLHKRSPTPPIREAAGRSPVPRPRFLLPEPARSQRPSSAAPGSAPQTCPHPGLGQGCHPGWRWHPSMAQEGPQSSQARPSAPGTGSKGPALSPRRPDLPGCHCLPSNARLQGPPARGQQRAAGHPPPPGFVTWRMTRAPTTAEKSQPATHRSRCLLAAPAEQTRLSRPPRPSRPRDRGPDPAPRPGRCLKDTQHEAEEVGTPCSRATAPQPPVLAGRGSTEKLRVAHMSVHTHAHASHVYAHLHASHICMHTHAHGNIIHP